MAKISVYIDYWTHSVVDLCYKATHTSSERYFIIATLLSSIIFRPLSALQCLIYPLKNWERSASCGVSPPLAFIRKVHVQGVSVGVGRGVDLGTGLGIKLWMHTYMHMHTVYMYACTEIPPEDKSNRMLNDTHELLIQFSHQTPPIYFIQTGWPALFQVC